MLSESLSLAARVSKETGLEFTGLEGWDNDGCRWFELLPADYPPGQTFTLRIVVGWRRVDVYFRPGRFAGELVEAMRGADEAGRSAFCSILSVCRDAGAEILFTLNGSAAEPQDEKSWAVPWRSFDLVVSKGMLPINEGNTEADMQHIDLWTLRVAAAVLALLPLEVDEGEEEMPQEVVGLPEGAKLRVEVNRYERDRRNRAAALAIHGYSCKACDLDMEERYGSPAAGLIEVHHTTPISLLGTAYVIDLKTDLVPLCPNCHSVAHRRTPPFSVGELRAMLRGV